MVSDEIRNSAKILIVDDDTSYLRLYRTILEREGYADIKTARDPRGVLATFVEYQPDLLILDIAMPHLDGLQLLDILQRAVREDLSLPVLVSTAHGDASTRERAFCAGAVEVVAKPFDHHEFVLRVGNLLRVRMAVHEVESQTLALFQELLERTEEVSSYQAELKQAQLEVIARLARAGEQRDDDTGQHTQRVAVTSALLGSGLGLSDEEVEILLRAAPLHDVGKIGVPDSILLKPAKLSPEEFLNMQRHCRFGADLLAGGRSDVVKMAELIALSHHERWNGQGYPFGLQKDDVPREGRILTVADVFDALTHRRPYKDAWPIQDALREIQSQAGQQFDPEVVEVFMALPHAELV